MGKSLYSEFSVILERAEGQCRARVLEDLELLQCHGATSIPAIERIVADQKLGLELRRAGVWALGQLSAASAVPVLLQMLRLEGDPSLFWEAAKALAILSDKASIVNDVLQILAKTDEIYKRQALTYLLGHSPEGGVADHLMAILSNSGEGDSVRAQAAEGLAYARDSKAPSALVMALQDPSPEVRYWSAFALGQLRDPCALPHLQSLSEGGDVETVRAEARSAIEEIESAMRTD